MPVTAGPYTEGAAAMHRVLKLARNRLSLVCGVSGMLGIGAFGLLSAVSSVPDAGVLDPVMAAAAEDTRVAVLARGRTLGAVLGESTLSVQEQQDVLTAVRAHSNPSRLRAGTEIRFRVVRATDWIRGIDIAVSNDELVRVDRRTDGWGSALIPTPVRADTLAIGGTIDSDLWSSIVANAGLGDLPQADRAYVIHLLDRVFRWSVDFAREIQPSDSYRIVLEREVRPDGSMRSGRLLAAELVNAGRPLYAIWFDLHGDGEGGHYDLAGESNRAAFIRAPLEFMRISSRFNRNRFHPILQVSRPHIGVDYAAAKGTPVMATADGVVSFSGRNGGYGNSLEIRHDSGFVTRYAHLNAFVAGVGAGSRVAQGGTIGFVGMTGLATGPHLHYEMHRNGVPVDPLTVDIPVGEPIPLIERARWRAELNARLSILRTVPGRAVFQVAEGDTPAAKVPTALRR